MFDLTLTVLVFALLVWKLFNVSKNVLMPLVLMSTLLCSHWGKMKFFETEIPWLLPELELELEVLVDSDSDSSESSSVLDESVAGAAITKMRKPNTARTTKRALNAIFNVLLQPINCFNWFASESVSDYFKWKMNPLMYTNSVCYVLNHVRLKKPQLYDTVNAYLLALCGNKRRWKSLELKIWNLFCFFSPNVCFIKKLFFSHHLLSGCRWH